MTHEVIYVDGQVALEATGSYSFGSKLIYSCAQPLLNFIDKYETILYRVSEHNNVEGNQIEIKLARQGSSMKICDVIHQLYHRLVTFSPFRRNGHKTMST